MYNLASHPDEKDLMNSLRKQLADWCKTQGDPLPQRGGGPCSTEAVPHERKMTA
jgi:hypothetical protein